MSNGYQKKAAKNKIYCLNCTYFKDCKDNLSVPYGCSHPEYTQTIDTPIQQKIVFGDSLIINTGNDCLKFTIARTHEPCGCSASVKYTTTRCQKCNQILERVTDLI